MNFSLNPSVTCSHAKRCLHEQIIFYVSMHVMWFLVTKKHRSLGCHQWYKILPYFFRLRKPATTSSFVDWYCVEYLLKKSKCNFFWKQKCLNHSRASILLMKCATTSTFLVYDKWFNSISNRIFVLLYTRFQKKFSKYYQKYVQRCFSNKSHNDQCIELTNTYFTVAKCHFCLSKFKEMFLSNLFTMKNQSKL